jgi:hypothetical protein
MATRILIGLWAWGACLTMTDLVLGHLADVSTQVDGRHDQLVIVIAVVLVPAALAVQRFLAHYAAALLFWWIWLGVVFTAAEIPPMPVFMLMLVLPTAAFWYAVDRWYATGRDEAREKRLARDVAEIMERDR